MADPGFSGGEWWSANCIFGLFLRKTSKTSTKIWSVGGGGVVQVAPIDPPLLSIKYLIIDIIKVLKLFFFISNYYIVFLTQLNIWISTKLLHFSTRFTKPHSEFQLKNEFPDLMGTITKFHVFFQKLKKTKLQMAVQKRRDAVADPGFPRWGGATLEFGPETYYMAKFLPKIAWKWKKLDREQGRASLAPPLIHQCDVIPSKANQCNMGLAPPPGVGTLSYEKS